MSEAQRMNISVVRERAVLAAVLLPGSDTIGDDPLAELRSLADTAGAVVVDHVQQSRNRPAPGSYIGKGKLEELAQRVEEHDANVVIFNNELSPSQIRNIEEAVECKVLDRSELILDIFASRARTHEAKLQVELAQLEYTYPRLRAMWSHLERIVGGAPAGIGTRGPGEQQLEIDRRIVQNRKAEFRREIKRMQDRKRREIAQRHTDFFSVGIVGYTNAGKSTLFNTLTDGQAYADDKLFATLDTRTRRWDLGGSDEVMLSDTVGFIRNLPHHLVASFRATLEESIHADLLLVVLDATDPAVAEHLDTVVDVLAEIESDDQPRVLLLNKTDELEDNSDVLIWQTQWPKAIPISARHGIGLDQLVEVVRTHMQGESAHLTVRVPIRDGKALSFLESRATVHDRQYDTTHVDMAITIGRRQLDQLRASGCRFEVVEQASQ